VRVAHDGQLKRRLDALYSRFARTERIGGDPVQFPHRYSNPQDVESAALISASFAYGRVDLFKPVIARILDFLGPNPHRSLLSIRPGGFEKGISGLSYRFNRTKDIAAYLLLLSQALAGHGSLKSIFFGAQGGACERLSALAAAVHGGDSSAVYGGNERPPGLTQLLPDAARGSASKRMYMFLRWMVRSDQVDFGLWREFGTGNLVIPLDTHVGRISRRLGLTCRKSDDYRTALEITESLRRFSPDDPVKYDFALAHMGISGECTARQSADRCGGCELSRLCIDAKGR
jgi:uncharacterized protein (TIGR02757 family)